MKRKVRNVRVKLLIDSRDPKTCSEWRDVFQEGQSDRSTLSVTKEGITSGLIVK